MKIKFLFLISILLISSHSYAQSLDNRDVFFIGHSLVNLEMPYMFDQIALSKSKTNSYDLQMGIGAPLAYNYTNPDTAQGVNAQDSLPTGNYNTLVMTEAIPLIGHLTYSDTYGYATIYHDLAAAVNPNMQTYIYETWHCIDSGTPTGCDWDDNDHIPWRDRLDLDLPLWEGIADSMEILTAYNAPPVLIIPAGQALGAVYDSIAIGALPGLTDISELFADNIHMNDLGNYFIALVQYAAIYRENPVGAIANIMDVWGTSYDIPHGNTALITKLQNIAWEVVCNYPRSGAACSFIVLATSDLTLRTEIKDKLIKLTWPSPEANEYATIHIEHSRNGQTFELLKTMSSSTLSAQNIPNQFYHQPTESGLHYYRLKYIQHNGEIEYSNVAFANISAQLLHFYPNPTTGLLYTKGTWSSGLTVQIFNSHGQLVKIEEVQEEKSIDLSDLPNGLYFIQIPSILGSGADFYRIYKME